MNFPADKAKQIRLLVLDVDGVLTDGRLYYDADGNEAKVFHVRDGYGIKRAMSAGITVAVISGRESRALKKRLSELGISHAILGREDKDIAVAELLGELQIDARDMACVGDDSPDIGMMRRAGLAIAVADAEDDVLAVADWCTSRPGGRGAVREVCDRLIEARG